MSDLGTSLGALAGAGLAIYGGQPELIPLAAGAGASIGGSLGKSSKKMYDKHKKKKHSDKSSSKKHHHHHHDEDDD